jgi:hypothetical protein
VCLTFLILIFVLLRESEELLQDFNRGLEVALFLVDETNFLIALSFFMDVICLLRNLDALVVELEGHLVLPFVLVLLGDLLVDTHEVFEDFNFDSFEVLILAGDLESSFKLAHSFKLVLNVLLTESKTLVGESFSLEIFEIQRNIKAALMEVGGCAVIELLLVAMSHGLVSTEALLVFTITPVIFGRGKVLIELEQVTFDLLLIRFGGTGLDHFPFLHVSFVRLDEVGSSLLS